MKKTEWISYRAENRSKRCKWPSEIGRKETPKQITLTVDESTGDVLKSLDPWGMACRAAYVSKHPEANPDVHFEIADKPDKQQLEALKRRLSFLNEVNSFGMSLKVKGRKSKLYSFDELMARTEKEKTIIEDVDSSEEENSDPFRDYLFDPNSVMESLKSYLRSASMGRCPAHCCKGEVLRTIAEFEKDILAGGASAKGKSNRFCALGEDFGGKKSFDVLRGVSIGVRKGKTSVLPREVIDFVTLNRHRQLALVDLRVDESGLQALSDALNASLLFRVYWKPILKTNTMREAFEKQMKGQQFAYYIAGNSFHPLFDLTAQYYSPSDKWDFELKKAVLGSTLPL